MQRVATLVAQRLAWMMATELGHGVQGIALDWAAPGFTDVLRQLGVELLIHTAGPFQQQDYAVAKAAAAAAAHYIDLADGRRFVCDFPAAMDAACLTAGRTGISGASTVPALSSAVVDQDHGPEIPCMAVILIARRLALGVAFPPGAMTGMGRLDLGAFEPEFARWRRHSPIKNAQQAAALVVLSRRTA